MGPAHLSRLNVLSYTSCVWPLVRHATVVTIVTTDRMAHVRGMTNKTNNETIENYEMMQR